MAQIYLLSVVANMVAGLTLAGDYFGARMGFLAGFNNLRAKRGPVVSLGVATALIGLLKLIVGSPGETVAFAGDLLPGLAGVGLGLMLLAEKRTPAPGATETGQKVERAIGSALARRVPAGIAGVVVAIVHFLFPAVPIL